MSKSNAILLDLSTPAIKRFLVRHVKSLAGLYWVEIWRDREQRTDPQNRYFHGVVLPVIAKGLTEAWGEPWGLERTKTLLKERYLEREIVNRRTGQVMGTETPSTADLDVPEFGVFIDQCIDFGDQYAGVDVPPPNRGYGFGTPKHPLPARQRKAVSA